MGLDVFQSTTNSGGTIQKALDFAMNTNPGDELADELYPNIAAVGAIYGDSNGKYAAFLAHAEETYPAEPFFLWDQPLSDSGWVALNPNYGGNTGSGNNTVNNGAGNGSTGGNGNTGGGGGAKVVAGTISLAALSLFTTWLLA